jgi:hypothetical protein
MPEPMSETQLAFAAYYQGRAAAETYRREGSEHPPALAGPTVPPVSLTQVLLNQGEKPTGQQVQTVATEWTRGVNDVWGG